MKTPFKEEFNKPPLHRFARLLVWLAAAICNHRQSRRANENEIIKHFM